ncbi:uncharacterized protein EI97DRAFT_421556 [Westerdykella ornata]|uniref:Poly(A) RNA polymerase mitochondrial-like central palm domain-containing protein n=1 Tax=Westerdykella ornata TaxID=318751 RepID=A0A6A6JF40_WESOR|nr:uncharacterized protein EI97DRAFT_421556 [Westerdykella ornata]KAF2274885.1 hypothetical protein EI97DRAFT_421556 [Westerdykella ornata]
MKSASGFRLTCRSHNPFRPSLVLWQHFVLPHASIRFYQRPSSSDTQPVEPGLPSVSNSSDPQSRPNVPNNDASSTPPGSGNEEQRFKIRRTRLDSKPKRELASPIAVALRCLYTFSDYKGVPILPKSRRKIKDMWMPWMTESALWNRPLTGMERVSLEISKFYEWAKPTPNESRARDRVMQQVLSTVQIPTSRIRLELFGSERSGLALPLSDIDFRVLQPDIEGFDLNDNIPSKRRISKRTKRLLDTLKFRFLKDETHFKTPAIHIFSHPLISVSHTATTLDVQLVCCNDTSAQQDAIAKYIRQYPQLPAVYTVVRAMMKARGLAEPAHGGFGAYTTLMMVVAAFRHTQLITSDPGHSLMKFLNFWASFDTLNGLSISPPELFDKEAEPVLSETAKQDLLDGRIKALPPWMLCLRDPVDPTNNLGRKSASIKHFQATCKHLADSLTYNYRLCDRGSRPPGPLLWSVVGPPDPAMLRRRYKLEVFGSKKLEPLGEEAQGGG